MEGNPVTPQPTNNEINPVPQSQRSPGSRPGVQCRYFMNNGYCFYGENCTFLHSSAGLSMGGGMANGTMQSQISGKQDRFFNEDESVFSPNGPVFVPSSSTSAPPAFSTAIEKHHHRMAFNKSHSTTTDSGASKTELLERQIRRMRLQQNMDNDLYQNQQPSPTASQKAKESQQQQQNNLMLNTLQFPSSQKADKTSYFISQQMRMELQKQRSLALAETKDSNVPMNVDNYHTLYPLEDLKTTGQNQLFGHSSSCYRATNSKDGVQYCLRRIHGYRLLNPKAASIVEQWKKIQNTNIVQLLEVFTTKNFGDTSLVFVYNYYPGAETLMTRHFKTSNGMRSPASGDNFMAWQQGSSSPSSQYSSGKQQPKQKVMPERLIWSYIIQMTAAIRQIHSLGLACRVIDPSKVILIGNSRLRLNCVGVLDILSTESEANNKALVSHYQQEDLVALGKLILALACYSIEAVQRENIHNSLEFLTRNYSNDLKTLVLHLVSSQVTSNAHSINEVMPVIGARFYSQLDSTQSKSDLLETEVSKEMENGRLLRILSKLNTILERTEFSLDPEWSETGDRYLLKLFRDYMFHQVTETGAAWIDFAHIVSCLNKLDAGCSDRICLSSRDEQSILVVSYHDLKACLETAFSELLQMSQS